MLAVSSTFIKQCSRKCAIVLTCVFSLVLVLEHNNVHSELFPSRVSK